MHDLTCIYCVQDVSAEGFNTEHVISQAFGTIRHNEIAEMSTSSPLYTDVIFLVPVPDWRPDEATPLQGFSWSLCNNAGLIRAAALLPSNVYDLTPEGRETFLARRIGGRNPVQLVSPVTARTNLKARTTLYALHGRAARKGR